MTKTTDIRDKADQQAVDHRPGGPLATVDDAAHKTYEVARENLWAVLLTGMILGFLFGSAVSKPNPKTLRHLEKKTRKALRKRQGLEKAVPHIDLAKRRKFLGF